MPEEIHDVPWNYSSLHSYILTFSYNQKPEGGNIKVTTSAERKFVTKSAFVI
jgi:hypothetical protein